MRRPSGNRTGWRCRRGTAAWRRTSVATPRGPVACAARGRRGRTRRDRRGGRLPRRFPVADAVAATLAAAPGVTVDYVEVLDPETLASARRRAARGEAGDGSPEVDQLLVAVAAYVGPVRLIDNVVVGDTEDEDRLLAATG